MDEIFKELHERFSDVREYFPNLYNSLMKFITNPKNCLAAYESEKMKEKYDFHLDIISVLDGIIKSSSDYKVVKDYIDECVETEPLDTTKSHFEFTNGNVYDDYLGNSNFFNCIYNEAHNFVLFFCFEYGNGLFEFNYENFKPILTKILEKIIAKKDNENEMLSSTEYVELTFIKAIKKNLEEEKLIDAYFEE